MESSGLNNYFKQHKKLVLLILIPLVTSIIPLTINGKEAKCAFVLIIMSLYWTTECLPIAITSLIPIVLFPIFGIMTSKAITKTYFQDIILLFYGGLVMANAIEISGLHERVSLKVLLLFGSNPKWLMLGFMSITGFMSLWISNAASCSMMLPMINAVVQQLVLSDEIYHPDEEEKEVGKDNSALVASEIQMEHKHVKLQRKPSTYEEITMNSKKARHLSTGFMLACSYSSTIGGLGSLVGTPPNILLKGFIDEKYPNVGISFLNFSLFALPVSIIMILFAWIWISIRFLPKEYLFNRMSKEEANDQSLNYIIQQKYASLGPILFQQKCVGVIFFGLVVLWLTRDIHGLHGWGLLFEPRFVSDSTPAVLAVLFLFACPKENIFKGKEYEHLMDWKQLQSIFPWNVILLIGGGLAIAEGFQHSGLSHFIGENIKTIMSTRKELTLFLITIISALATEFTSNTSISSIFIPIVDSIAVEMNISPIYLLLPLILSVSLAFMLPVATPNNALIFSSGTVKMKDMITTGIVMNVIGLTIVNIAANTWLKLIFDVSIIPISSSSKTTWISQNISTIFQNSTF